MSSIIEHVPAYGLKGRIKLYEQAKLFLPFRQANVKTYTTYGGSGMGLFSSSRPGPLAPQDSAVVVAATALASLPPDAQRDAVQRAKADLSAAAIAQVVAPKAA